jgi:hypothetical protein
VHVDETDAGRLPALCHHRIGISAPALALATSQVQERAFTSMHMIPFCQQAVIFGRYTQLALSYNGCTFIACFSASLFILFLSYFLSYTPQEIP